MAMRKLTLLLALLAIPLSGLSQAAFHNHDEMWEAYPFYLGTEFGWGSTDWNQLTVPPDSPNLLTLSLSAPIKAGDKGFVYGFMTGYEINPHFAIELNYMRFPNTVVTFDPLSLYAFNNGITSMKSSAYVYNAVGKFMVEINDTGIRAFANAGGALIHRHDALAENGHIGPTFGIGMGYVLIQRVMLELAFQYYAGYGKVVLEPAINYIPFLYTVHFKIGYRF